MRKARIDTNTKENNSEALEAFLPLRWGIFRSFFLLLIRLYQRWLSPVMGNQCRFYPSCSDYALLNFSYRPLVYAFISTLWRILRCNPWNHNVGVEYPWGISAAQADVFLKKNSARKHKHDILNANSKNVKTKKTAETENNDC